MLFIDVDLLDMDPSLMVMEMKKERSYLSHWIFHNQDICYSAKLTKVISQFVGCGLPRQTSDKQFAWRRVWWGRWPTWAGWPVLWPGIRIATQTGCDVIAGGDRVIVGVARSVG